MFLIHGIRRKVLRGELLPGQCVKCGNEGGMQLMVVQPYVHLFWLPLFPLTKRARWRCMLCDHEVKQSGMPDHAKAIFPVLKGQVCTPWWTFTGVVLLAAPLVLGVRSMMAHEDEQEGYLTQPQVGDVWTMKLGHKHYTLQRVEEVRSDSVFVRANTDEVHDAGIMRLIKFREGSARHFTGERIGYARSELIALDKKGPLYGIDRPVR